MFCPGRLVPVFLAFLALQGCTARYHNTEEARTPFPEAPANPNGVCPDLTGIYYAYTCSEEPGDEYADITRIPSSMIGTPVVTGRKMRTVEEPRTTQEGPRKVLPKCSPSLVIQSFIALRYLTEEQLEARSWGSTERIATTIYDPKGGSGVCDKGKRYWHDKGESHGVEGGSIYKGVDTFEKSPEGDLIYKRYLDHGLYAYGTIPTGGSRTVNTYRYRAYHGSMPYN